MHILAAPIYLKSATRLAIATLMMIPMIAISTTIKADSSDVANSLPAQIPEILTGGTWSNGNVGGVYRAVVVLSKTERKKSNLLAKASSGKDILSTKTPIAERKAEVFIQWIAYNGNKTSAKIVKSVSVKEFNEKQLRHAFLAMDTLTDNEMTLLVTSYDEHKDKDISISVRATAPGQYEPSKSKK